MSVLISRVTKAALGAAAILAVSTSATVMSTSSAEAQWAPRPGWGGPGYRARPAYGAGYGYRPYRPARGAAVAAGIIGGIAAGALIAGAASPAYAVPGPSYGYAPSYDYAPSYGHAPSYGYAQPTYYQPAYETYQPSCYFKKVRQVVDYDTVVIRRVRVCR